MLPVGGIIVGVIALLLGGYAAIQVSKLNKTMAEQETKLAKIDTVESTATAAAASAERAAKQFQDLRTQTQAGFDQVGPAIGKLQESVTKLEEAMKKPAPTAAKKGGSGEPVTAAPGEYVIKAGDTFAKIARAHGVSINDVAAVNPGVNSSNLKVGQKIKLPSKK